MSTKNIPVGTICRAEKARAKSLKFWDKMKAGMPYLLCPCSLQGCFVSIQVEAEPGNYIVKVMNDKKLKLSAFNKNDLIPRNLV